MNAFHRTACIGIMSTGFPGHTIINNQYSAGILSGILTMAEERDYNVTLFTRAWEARETCEAWLRETPIAGIIMLAPSIHTAMIGAVNDSGIPVINITADAGGAGRPAGGGGGGGGAGRAAGRRV